MYTKIDVEKYSKYRIVYYYPEINYYFCPFPIATPKGSKWRDKISKAILFLQEKGVIQMYYDKWWKSHGKWSEYLLKDIIFT